MSSHINWLGCKHADGPCIEGYAWAGRAARGAKCNPEHSAVVLSCCGCALTHSSSHTAACARGAQRVYPVVPPPRPPHSHTRSRSCAAGREQASRNTHPRIHTCPYTTAQPLFKHLPTCAHPISHALQDANKEPETPTHSCIHTHTPQHSRPCTPAHTRTPARTLQDVNKGPDTPTHPSMHLRRPSDSRPGTPALTNTFARCRT